MFRTIQLSSRVSVQGRFVEDLDDGEVLINDGVRNWRGRPIEYSRAPCELPGPIALPLRSADAVGA